MNIVIAIDSFKGSLSSLEAGRAAAEGCRAALPDAETRVCPLADGGEGTVAAIVAAAGGRICRTTVTGPLGDPVVAEYGILDGDGTAVIEMATAAGITLISSEERDPLRTTTYGVGELIVHALAEGCRRFVVGIGGSATNDGGVGMLQALGFSFTDAEGREIPRGAVGLSHLSAIHTEGAHPLLSQCEFEVACDVTNPLCGPLGCSAVFGPQKGATPEVIPQMDASLSHYAALSAAVLGADHANRPGAGAAGGMGFALMAYLGATTESGIDLVMRTAHLEESILSADLVITGEGRLDGQSAMGKAPVGVARLAKKHGKPVIAFCGAATEDAILCHEAGIDAFFPILRGICTLEEAMNVENASRNLRLSAEQALRLYLTARKEGFGR